MAKWEALQTHLALLTRFGPLVLTHCYMRWPGIQILPQDGIHHRLPQYATSPRLFLMGRSAGVTR
jgi:hypothetical protein